VSCHISEGKAATCRPTDGVWQVQNHQYFLKIQDSVGLYQKLFKSVNFDRVNNNKDVFETMHICVNVNVSVNSRFMQRIIAKLLMRCVR